MGEKKSQSRKRVYGFITITLVLCIGLSVFLSSNFSAKPPVQAQESDTQPEVSTPNHAADASMTATQNNSLITEDEATSIAMPLIEQYANENNRTIETVNATFYAGPAWQPRPSWEIRGKFVSVTDLDAPEHWIVGYCVLVWADTGEIRDASEEGIM